MTVKNQPSQDILQGDTAEEELGLAHLVSSYTLPHLTAWWERLADSSCSGKSPRYDKPSFKVK